MKRLLLEELQRRHATADYMYQRSVPAVVRRGVWDPAFGTEAEPLA